MSHLNNVGLRHNETIESILSKMIGFFGEDSLATQSASK